MKTKDPIQGWEAGLVWVFFQSFILMIGGFIAPWVRKITPRAALLGTLAGVSITFIAMRPALEMYQTPVIGLICFAIILVNWLGGFKYPMGIPAGLVAIVVGTIIAWGSNVFGLNYGGLTLKGVGDAFTNFGFNVPIPAVGYVFSGFKYLAVILVTAIPFGVYDLVEAMDNVESAEAGGDAFPTTRVLTADGIVSLIGCLMGNPFINAVYIGHPGWKGMGGRIGYSAAVGIMVIILSWFGIISLLLAIVPVVAISPILLYIGMLIGAQAFQTTPKAHAPAIVLALTPHLAAWCQTLDGRRTRCCRHQRRAAWLRQTCRRRRSLPRPRDHGRRRDPHRTGAGGDGRVHHRQELHQSIGLRSIRRRAYLLRIYARLGRRHCGLADACDHLRRGRHLPLRAQPVPCSGAGADGSRGSAGARGVSHSD